MYYFLSEEMRNELLSTFRYARDKALQNKDEDSASYYWGLVDYLQGLPKVTKTPLLEEDNKSLPVVKQKPMTLKEIADMLKSDNSLTPEEKFDLYYEAREAQKGKKDSYTLAEMLKKCGIEKSR